MKEIKIAFENWYPGFNITDLGPAFNNNPYLKKDDYRLVIDQNNPDIVFFGVFRNYIEQVCCYDDKPLKVLFITEPISPDFSFFDYVITYEPYDFDGRVCYYPHFVYSMYDEGTLLNNNVSNEEINSIFKLKDKFCEMVYSHDGVDVSRKHYYDLLSKYKRVESAGTYQNNQPNSVSVEYHFGNKSKFEFQKRFKFSLCIQSIKKDWFINEKIIHSFFANEIPIFYGTEHAKEIFNPKRFLYIEDYSSDQDLLNRIIEIDQNDELFKSIISEPIFINDNFINETVDNACKFVYELVAGIKQRKLINKNRETIAKSFIVELHNRSATLGKIEHSFWFRVKRRIRKLFGCQK